MRSTAVLFAATLLAGCATIATTPRVPAAAPPVTLRGQVDFEGPRERLPAPLAALPSAAPDAASVFRYRYDTQYHDLDLSVLAIFNPLTLFGCPTGSASLVADATLDVVANGATVKRYAAHSVASRLRTVYSGDPLSELRAGALRAAADSIAAQLATDPPPSLPEPGMAPDPNGGDR